MSPVRTRVMKLLGEVAADLALTSFLLSVATVRVDGGETEMRFEVVGFPLDRLVEEFGAALEVAGFGESTAESDLGD